MKPVMNNMSVVVSHVLQSVVRYFNPFMRLVLGSRAHRMMSGQLMLLSFTGRRTGRSYTTPVSYVREGTNLLVPGGGAWWKNLTSGTARVRLQGTWHVVTPEVIREPGALSAVLGRMLAINPAIAVFTGIRPGSDGRPFAKSLERERRRGSWSCDFTSAPKSDPAVIRVPRPCTSCDPESYSVLVGGTGHYLNCPPELAGGLLELLKVHRLGPDWA